MIKIEQAESSPYLEVNLESYEVLLKGNSFVSNPHVFYKPLVEWGNAFKLPEEKHLHVHVTMGYYSTSNIQILNILFKTLNQNNPEKVELTFHLEHEEEEDLEETILSLAFNTGLKYKKAYISE